MSQVAKLKKQAAEFEAKKQFDKAIGVYIKLLEGYDSYPAELDIGLFNRVGDLLIRQGNVADAVDSRRERDLYRDRQRLVADRNGELQGRRQFDRRLLRRRARGLGQRPHRAVRDGCARGGYAQHHGCLRR